MSLSFRAIALASVSVLSLGGLAYAQQPAPDPAAIFSIQGENSSISTAKLTDRYYTNGIHIGWTSPENYAPALEGIGRTLYGEGAQRVAIDISQQMYTPADTSDRVPPPGDRPYAGVLLARVSQTTDAADSRSAVGFSLGMIGPAALGEEVQNGFHDLIGQGHNNGWSTQLHNEPVFAFDSSRVWRLPTGSVFGLETDALPGASATLGTLRIAFETGINFRIGQGLQNDYGAPRIRALGGGDAFLRGPGVGWYVFAGVDGQAVVRDVTLDGNTWQDSNSVKLQPFVGQFQGGIAIMAFGARLTYTHVVQTQDFKHQKGGPHQFGSLALSVRF